MAIQTTYSQARANLAKLCDKVSGNREIVIFNRRNAEDVAIISAGELSCRYTLIPQGGLLNSYRAR